MKKYLSPSMLAADFKILGEQLKTVEEAGAKMLHVDVMDGLFVPSISYGMPVIASIRSATDMEFDVHMMVTEPERYIEAMRKSGADIISFHVEATKDPAVVLRQIRECGAKPAIAVSPDTPIDAVAPYVKDCYMVLVMSVYPGFGGQKFIEATYDRIMELRRMRETMGLDFLIEVDGGIYPDNLCKVLESGTDVIVAGSAVFGGDIAANVKKFNDIIARYE